MIEKGFTAVIKAFVPKNKRLPPMSNTPCCKRKPDVMLKLYPLPSGTTTPNALFIVIIPNVPVPAVVLVNCCCAVPLKMRPSPPVLLTVASILACLFKVAPKDAVPSVPANTCKSRFMLMSFPSVNVPPPDFVML